MITAKLLTNNSSCELLPDKISADLVKVYVISEGGGGSSLVNWISANTDRTVVLNNGYVTINDLSRIVLTLPTTSPASGNYLIFQNRGIAGFKIQQSAANQQISVGNVKSTIGLSGAINSYDVGDFLQLEFIENTWVATKIIGNLEVI